MKVERRVNVMGRNVPANKESPEAYARLQNYVRERWEEGYNAAEIAPAVDLSRSRVRDVLHTIYGPGPLERRYSSTGNRPPLLFFDWRSAPPIDLTMRAPYRRSVTVQMVETCERELREINAEHCFAGDVEDARDANDQRWLAHTRAALDGLRAYLHRLEAVLADPHAVSRDVDRRDDVAQIAQYRRRAGG